MTGQQPGSPRFSRRKWGRSRGEVEQKDQKMTKAEGVAFGVADLLTAVLVMVGVFMGLPARWAPVDVPAIVLIAFKLVSGVSLIVRSRWAPRMATVGAALALALGLALVTGLALTASWLSGVYGSVGQGGALLLTLVAALALPYLVVLPVVQLVWLRPIAWSRPGREVAPRAA
jgi:hypothetical protein